MLVLDTVDWLLAPTTRLLRTISNHSFFAHLLIVRYRLTVHFA